MTYEADDVLINDELTEGASNAVNVCLRVAGNEKVTLITDERTRDIAMSLRSEVEKTGADCSFFVLEDFGPRPHTDMPRPILDDLATSQVSIYAVWGQPGELRTRMQMTAVVGEHGLRHAHMINVSRRIMKEGMRADFREVDELSRRVVGLARRAKKIRATTPAGTDVVADFSPDLQWLKTSGIITSQKWGNLPGGEVLTAPADVNGVYVVDGVVGDYLCAKYGSLAGNPITLVIENGRMVSADCTNEELRKEFWDYCHTDRNSDRVGEFAIGTNIHVRSIIGQILQDEKIPGVHIAFGHPYAEHTGASWSSSTHIDVVGTQFDVWMDDLQIMHQGRFVI